MPAVSSRLAPRLKRVCSSPPDNPRLRSQVWLLPKPRCKRDCRPGSVPRRVKIWITPPIASLPYSTEREPRSTSTRSICSMLRCCRLLSPEVELPMRWPSTSTRLWAERVPRMLMPGRLPRPPVCTTCTPGTRRSRSVTLVGCRRSMSSRVNTVLAALLSLRASTWRSALISMSGIFSACSRAMVSASSWPAGSRERVRARRESFIGIPERGEARRTSVRRFLISYPVAAGAG
ncbi:hypothetical protein D9M71_204620 [compost metagenome]